MAYHAGVTPTRTQTADGPLVVSATNPRYFAVRTPDGGERAIYLTGSHVNNNFGDSTVADVLTAHDHNFVRLWRWEQFRSEAAGGAFHLCMSSVGVSSGSR